MENTQTGKPAQSGEYAVELRDVVKAFSDIVAVDHVNMAIRHKEFFSMLGPSGCGKTTCLRMIAGFEQPTSGEVLISGKEVGTTPPFYRNVNTVFQSYALFPHMTVEQNVAFGLEMKNTARDEIKKRVGQALELVRLPQMAKRYPKQMSGGQQQRIALARALVNRPQVLLLDEPLGALDAKLRKEMQIELKTLQKEVGITFIFVTHDQEEALTMSDRIAVFSKGKVLQIGTPLEIYERPNCRFVADFIGEANFLSGKLKEINGEHGTVLVEGDKPFVGRMNCKAQPGDEVTIAVRPEKVQLLDKRPDNSTNTYESLIHSVGYVGSDTRVMVLLGNMQLDVWEQNSVSTLDPNYFFRPGEKAFFTFRPDNALILTD
jgi:spermidine/putrescine transport system ATP-binding protein